MSRLPGFPARRGARGLTALALAAGIALVAAGARAQGAPGAPGARPGMVVKGDREGPQGLVVLPWQEPSRRLAEVPLQGALPVVLESLRSVAEDPLNRALPGGAAARAAPPAEERKEAPKSGRRGRGQREEPPRPMIMQHQKQ